MVGDDAAEHRVGEDHREAEPDRGDRAQALPPRDGHSLVLVFLAEGVVGGMVSGGSRHVRISVVRAVTIGGTRPRHGRTASNAAAARSTERSSRCRPMI